MIGRGRTGATLFSSAVLAGTLAFALYARATQTAPGQERYDLSARFVSANGLARGADVALAGVPVGRVSSVTLDPTSQMAIVKFRVNTELKIPDDSTLTIGSSTLSDRKSVV